MPDTRSLADRIAAVQRATPLTDDEHTAAEQLLADMLAAAGRHGVTLADLDWTIDLPGGCVDVIRSKTRRP
ncbi:hypothetical protein ACFWPY_39815 [Streptomyces sp. NPDC058527]|uniref:hypothetical protein n=1 Tax=Streptomyces sp. NPDC058527 TaxID=3346539 RepID=UPI0036593374